MNSTVVTYPQAADGFARQLLADARFYHGLRSVGRARAGSLAWTAFCSRGLWLLTFHRIAYYCLSRRNLRNPLWWVARLCKGIGVAFSVLCCRSQLAEDCAIEGSAYLSNQGYLMCGALSIGHGSLIHDHCTFGHAVARGDQGRPKIGRHVWIGPGCVIAGPLTVGDGATVLPGSVLTFSVPARAVVKGNPARIVRTDFDNAALLRSLAPVAQLGGSS